MTAHASQCSQECRANSVFAVVRGSHDDGARHIPDAISRGAQSLLVDRPLPEFDLPQVVVPDVRRAFAELCATIAGHPDRHLQLAGVTGTNGKTTTTWLIRSILNAASRQTGLIGTIEYHDGLTSVPAELTTPDAATLSHWLGRMVSQGTTHAALEVSSHALDQKRLAGTLLDAAVIANITQDHFDYHGSFAAYRQAKLRILDYLKPAGFAVINRDDPGARSCLVDSPKRTLTYSLSEPADVQGTITEQTPWGSRFVLKAGGREIPALTPLVGRHNVANCLAAATVAHAWGIDLDIIARGISRLQLVPGRLERVDQQHPFPIFVDFAHTPDALERVLDSLRPLATGRLICVFGAGGDRDRSKRPLMGHAVAQRADIAIVTSDNPRSEDPHQIIGEIVAGMKSAEPELIIESDRRTAIRTALQLGRAGDVVVIAGKGHEKEQIVGSVKHRFDDAEVTRECLLELTGRPYLVNTNASPLEVPVSVPVSVSMR